MSDTLTLRGYLIAVTMVKTGCGAIQALEAVSTTALEHPEWDLDEKKTWSEWAKELGD